MQNVKTAMLTISEALNFELVGIPYLNMSNYCNYMNNTGNTHALSSKTPQNVKFGAA